MTWKEQVKQLEKEASFDIAIFWLEKQIKEDPNSVDPYIFLFYRLIDSIVDNARYWTVSQDPLRSLKKEYYALKVDTYKKTLRYYFDISYEKFSENPEYLFYVSGLLIPSYWFCCLDQLTDDFLDEMQKKAFSMGYNTILANEWRYRKLKDIKGISPEVLVYAQKLINDPALQEQLINKGAAAEYIFGGTLAWANDTVETIAKQEI